MQTTIKTERLFYLDFIRAIATIIIVITHYNANYMSANPEITGCYIISSHIFNIYSGYLGVSLFLIISGASLMYSCSNNIDIKKFYLKRFQTIYPMYWIVYIGAFFYYFVHRGAWKLTSVPYANLFLTFLGMDGYLADKVPTFYLVGEWFVGFIVLFYIIFPLLKYAIKKCPGFLFFGAIMLYILCIYCELIDFPNYKNIFIRLPELLFGMYFIKKNIKVKGIIAFFSVFILLFNEFAKPKISTDIQTTYVGVATFIVLVYVSYYIEKESIKKICSWLCKYSYAIFLTHHFIMFIVMNWFDLYSFNLVQSYIVFFGICVVTIIISVGVYSINVAIHKGAWWMKSLFSRK